MISEHLTAEERATLTSRVHQKARQLEREALNQLIRSIEKFRDRADETPLPEDFVSFCTDLECRGWEEAASAWDDWCTLSGYER